MSDGAAAGVDAGAGARSRAAWGVADQAVSSLTQLGVAVLAARSLSPDDFGGFAAAVAVYLLALAVGRALCGEVLTVRHAGTAARAAAPASMGAAVVVGAVLGLACVAAGVSIGGPFGESAVVIGAALPLLLLQDAVRYVWAAKGEPIGAFVVDVLWVVLLAIGTAVAGSTSDLTPTTVALAFAASGALSAVAGVLWLRQAPRVSSARRWLRDGSDLGGRFTIELLVSQGAGQLLVAGVGLVAGAADAGAMRGVQVLFGPLTVLLVGVRFAAVPEGARLAARSGDPGAAVTRRSAQLSAAFVASAGLALVVLALLPDRVGEAVLGDTWAAAELLVVPWGIFMGWQALLEGASIGLRSLAAAVRSLRAALTGTLVTLAAGVGGAAVDGVRTGTWVLAGAGAFSAAIWWSQLRSAAAAASASASRAAR